MFGHYYGWLEPYAPTAPVAVERMFVSEFEFWISDFPTFEGVCL
jgi:hypothetical protein